MAKKVAATKKSGVKKTTKKAAPRKTPKTPAAPKSKAVKKIEERNEEEKHRKSSRAPRTEFNCIECGDRFKGDYSKHFFSKAHQDWEARMSSVANDAMRQKAGPKTP